MTSRRNFLGYGLAIPVAGLSVPAFGQNGGRYYSAPRTRWNTYNDGMTLLEDFRYRDPAGQMWKAPKGSSIDGASIPRIAWTLAGSPYQVPYRDASIIHDYYCDSMKRSWEDTHRVFYEAMLTSGTSREEAIVKYWAVVRAGPRWDKHDRWSGLWPFRQPRADRPYHGPPPPPPPPPIIEEAAANVRRQEEKEKRLRDEFGAISAGVQAGSVSATDVPRIVEQQIRQEPNL